MGKIADSMTAAIQRPITIGIGRGIFIAVLSCAAAGWAASEFASNKASATAEYAIKESEKYTNLRLAELQATMTALQKSVDVMRDELRETNRLLRRTGGGENPREK